MKVKELQHLICLLFITSFQMIAMQSSLVSNLGCEVKLRKYNANSFSVQYFITNREKKLDEKERIDKGITQSSTNIVIFGLGGKKREQSEKVIERLLETNNRSASNALTVAAITIGSYLFYKEEGAIDYVLEGAGVSSLLGALWQRVVANQVDTDITRYKKRSLVAGDIVIKPEETYVLEVFFDPEYDIVLTSVNGFFGE